MKKSRWILLIATLFFWTSSFGYVGPDYVGGPITNITSIGSGILIRVGNDEVPQNCTSGYVWMLIPQANTSMTALVLAAWSLKREVHLYTSASSSGYCQINQFDPAES